MTAAQCTSLGPATSTTTVAMGNGMLDLQLVQQQLGSRLLTVLQLLTLSPLLGVFMPIRRGKLTLDSGLLAQVRSTNLYLYCPTQKHNS